MRRLILVLGLIGGLLALPVAAAGFDDAMNAYRAGDFDTAFTGFLEVAQAGDHTAQHNVAVMYYRGEGVPRDLRRAYAWMTLAMQGDEAEFVRAHHVLMILSHPGTIAEGKRLARRLAEEHGLRYIEDEPVSGLRVVSGR